MSVTDITSDKQFTELTTSVGRDTLVTLFFHTPWADPCVQISGVFSSLAAIYPNELFLSIDADKFPDISESFDVSAVPYFVLLRDSTIVKELSGADPKDLAQTIQSLSKHSDGIAKNSRSPVPAGNSAISLEEDDEDEETEEELNERLKKLVNAAPIMLFMKGTPGEPKCGFSRQLVNILREHQVRFGFFDILKDNSVREGLKKLYDWPTFPQLYISGELQGGLDIVKETLLDDPEFLKNAANSAK